MTIRRSKKPDDTTPRNLPSEWSTVEPPHLTRLAQRASEDAHGVSPELLAGYLEMLADVSVTRSRPGADGLRLRRDLGMQAAEQGVPLRGLIDLYLSATWLAWPSLPGVRHGTALEELRATGEAVFRAADTAIIAVAEGYEEAQRWAIRQEESFRREFVDDLLDGRNLGQLAERAERYGLRLASTHVVAAATASEPFVDGGPVAQRVERALLLRVKSRDVLVTTKNGLLVCLAPHALPEIPEEFVGQIEAAMGENQSWQVGIGQPQRGPGGAVCSFEQARNALDIASRLRLAGHAHKAADLLVYQVLLRDTAALSELVNTTLGPMTTTRAGAQPLLDTLSAYFEAGQVATVAARNLHIGVRTVTYRLQRVKDLTGYAVDDPHQGFILQVAVHGARLLNWPNSSDSAWTSSIQAYGEHALSRFQP